MRMPYTTPVEGCHVSRFHVLLKPDKEDGGYVALVPSLPGCMSEGDTVEEALANIKDAIRLYLESEELGIAGDADAIMETVEL